MLKALPILQKKYLMDLLEELNPSSDLDVKEQFHQLKIPLEAERPSILMISRIDGLDISLSMTDKMKIVYGVESIANKYLSQVVNSFSLVYENRKLVWIIQPKKQGEHNVMTYNEDWNRIVVFLQGTMESIQEKCKDVLKVSTSLQFHIANLYGETYQKISIL